MYASTTVTLLNPERGFYRNSNKTEWKRDRLVTLRVCARFLAPFHKIAKQTDRIHCRRLNEHALRCEVMCRMKLAPQH